MQIHAETFNRIVLPRRHRKQNAIVNWRFRHCHQLHQTSKPNDGGGGARAARGIWIQLYYTVLYYIVSYCIIEYHTVYYIVLYCIVLYHIVVYYTLLHHTFGELRSFLTCIVELEQLSTYICRKPCNVD